MSRRAHGFTLLEVLVALAVVAIGLLALSRAAAVQVDTLAELEQRTYALWVADNVLTRVRLDPSWRAPGRYQGRERMGQAEWRWELLIQPSPDPAVLRLDVVVRPGEADRAAVLQHTGFVRAP